MPDDDLLRDAYCVFGIPIDVVEMPSVIHFIETAAARKVSVVISTPNLNFLVTAQSDPDFRETLLQSDLCPADGMPIVWIARLIGVPLKNRIAGADIFDALKARRNSPSPLKVFLFGGAEGVASAACRTLNTPPSGIHCVGSLFPGYGSVDEMSRDEIITEINSSDADLLVVSLGAKKGQTWLHRNHNRLLIPIQTHLGAVINFQAGTLRRAPRAMRKLGLEWLWRIKEEPYLWRRYWNDGSVLLRMLFTRILPLVLWTVWLRLRYERAGEELIIAQTHGSKSLTVSLSGCATARHVDQIILAFGDAVAAKKRIIIDFSDTSGVDARFLGLLLMLRKALEGRGADLILIGLSRALKTLFRLNGLEFMPSNDKTA